MTYQVKYDTIDGAYIHVNNASTRLLHTKKLIMFKIYPYKVGSQSARTLKASLDAVILKTENSRYRYRSNHIVINWGNSHRSERMADVPMLNQPEAVAVASNKLLTFQELHENAVPIVDFTVEKNTAQGWIEEGATVFVRNKLTGHSGDGIDVVKPVEATDHEDRGMLESMIENLSNHGYDYLAEEVESEVGRLEDTEQVEVPEAPLYTKGIDNKGEYRVHVFNGEVILYQKKSRKRDEDGEVETAEGEDADVRNLESNWIYRTGSLNKLERIEDLAIKAIEALGLDFGAVDIIMNQEGEVFVLEINSAPGLGNTDSVEAYTEAINDLTN